MAAITSPLRVHPTNGRYFADATGRAVYLTGSHTWATLQDIGLEGGPAFPFDEYLEMMIQYGHNFLRLWMFEQPERASWTAARILFDPLPWARTGPGLAADGLPRFDLTAWNPAYFARLRERVEQAGARGIYVSVMLFQGWSLHKTGAPYGDPWPVHPFNAANNVNGVDVPYGAQDDDQHPCLHSLHNPAALAHQEAYVRKVIETVGDLDNLLYEIINEGGATDWQIHMIRFIQHEAGLRGHERPVGMTHRISPKQFNSELFDSPAEWVSPAKEPQNWMYPGSSFLEQYEENPPAADGSKVVLLDTDHLWGHGGNAVWVWKSFLRGHNPIFMDPWWPLYIESTPDTTPWSFAGGITKDQRDYPDWEPTRRAMGDTRRLAERVDLARMLPRPELCSTGYCLADPGRSYIIYAPHGGAMTINLRGGAGPFAMEWFIPASGRSLPGAGPLPGGDYVVTVAPVTGDAVLLLTAVDTPAGV